MRKPREDYLLPMRKYKSLICIERLYLIRIVVCRWPFLTDIVRWVRWVRWDALIGVHYTGKEGLSSLPWKCCSCGKFFEDLGNICSNIEAIGEKAKVRLFFSCEKVGISYI